MAGNKSLNAAQVAKQDEFYTRREDIEAELQHYKQFFEGKTVYCNCDNPEASEFWRFFTRVFRDWHLRKLMATHYDPNEKNYSYKLELTSDGKNKPTITQIPGNGDFRSAACIELLKEADIVCTNPPFSLFREYIGQLMTYGKTFLVIGNLNAVAYKEIFPLLKGNKLRLGYHAGNMTFKVPDYYEPRATGYWQDETGQKWRSMGNTCWYTNLDIDKRHEQLDLRGNYYESTKYPAYDNYNAIEVKKVADIPCDYAGVMGVPITFLQHYSPDQFEVIGLTMGRNEFGKDARPSKRYVNALQHNKNGSVVNGSQANARATILNDHPTGVYYTADNADGKFEIVYTRVLIRNKHPEARRYV